MSKDAGTRRFYKSIRREDLEAVVLSIPEAAFSDQSKGRAIAEEIDQYRTCYQCDSETVFLHSKSFRRLAHKTQVFLAPEGDHYRLVLFIRLRR